MFRCGLFENPYLNPEESVLVIGSQKLCQAGYKAQLRSVVMVKNQDVLPVKKQKKVYIPDRTIKARKSFFRTPMPEQHITPVARELVNRYFNQTASPEEADFALVFIESPLSDGYSSEDRRQGGNGYVPISLQYRPYKAVAARNESIAGGDFREDFKNRSYKGKIGTAANEADLDLVLDAKAAMGDKPVVVCLRMHNPTIVSELEGAADAILIDFGVQAQAILDIVSGVAEPSALLPVPMPANMETVEKHCEDSPFDIEPYVDTCGHAYDFAFGMNWYGVIDDERVRRYENA